jgi:hypothetical protein
MSKLIKHIENSLKNTNNYNSKITKEILDIEGMSGKKTRHFYNNLCSMSDARYLEIGCWKGSSICAAMCNNNINCIAIDNWSEFGGPKDIFMNNFNKYIGENNAHFIEKNCWDVDPETIGKFNIYMYDGNHTETSHFKALNHFYKCLDDEFIYLIDDWNVSEVRKGTYRSISNNKFNILYKKEIFTPAKGGMGHNYEWWNGICIFVLKKNDNKNLNNIGRSWS